MAFDAAWNLFADGLIAKNDSHNFKFGVNYERSNSDYVTRRNGGFTYVDDTYYGGPDELGCPLDEYFADPSCALYSSDRGGEWNLRAEMEGFHALVCYGDYLREVGYALRKLGGIEWVNYSGSGSRTG